MTGARWPNGPRWPSDAVGVAGLDITAAIEDTEETTPEFTPLPGTGTRSYLPGIDGLRAVSVLAVLAYHLDADWARGGFLGVEVFFVVSGFLITSLLLAERRRDGAVDVLQFWRRRARRLLPAAVTVIVGCVVWATVAGGPGELARFRGDVVASLTYVQNWWAIFADQPYFQSFGRPSPLRHLWSLAIEEQFYLLWPLVLPAALRRLDTRRTALLLAALAVGSAVLMGLTADVTAPDRAYFGTDTRLSGILAGAVLAFGWRPVRARAEVSAASSLVLGGIGAAALLGLGHQLSTVSEFDPGTFPWSFLAVDLVTVAALVTATHPASPWTRILGLGPLQALGRRSYSLYLWHWPIIVFTRPGVDWPLTGPAALVARLALIAVCTELSFRIIEQPFRRGSVQRSLSRFGGPNRRLAHGLALASAAAVVILPTLAVTGLATTPPRETPAALTIGPLPAEDTEAGGPGSNAAASTVPSVATTRPVDAMSMDPTVPPAAPTGTPGDAPAAPPATPGPTTTPVNDGQPTATDQSAMAPEGAHVERSGPDITVVGESVTLGGARRIQEYYGPRVQIDASEGRHFNDGVELIEWLAAHNRLTPTVFVHLGTNGIAPRGALDRIVEAVGPTRRLVLVSVRVPRPWEKQVNGEIWRVLQEHAQVRLADWYRLANEEEGLLIDDGVHLSPVGQERYRDLLVGFAP